MMSCLGNWLQMMAWQCESAVAARKRRYGAGRVRCAIAWLWTGRRHDRRDSGIPGSSHEKGLPDSAENPDRGASRVPTPQPHGPAPRVRVPRATRPCHARTLRRTGPDPMPLQAIGRAHYGMLRRGPESVDAPAIHMFRPDPLGKRESRQVRAYRDRLEPVPRRRQVARRETCGRGRVGQRADHRSLVRRDDRRIS